MAARNPRSGPGDTCHRATERWTWATRPAGLGGPPAARSRQCRAGRRRREADPPAVAPPAVAKAARQTGPRQVPAAAISFEVPLGNGEAPPDPEGLGGHSEPGSRLLALVLVAVHLIDDLTDQLDGQATGICNLVGREVVLYAAAQNDVEHLIIRKR